jgi:hypothetical protein
LAVAIFAAVWFNKLSVDRATLLQGLAIFQLFVTAVNIITNKGVGDKVGTQTMQKSNNCAESFISLLQFKEQHRLAMADLDCSSGKSAVESFSGGNEAAMY